MARFIVAPDVMINMATMDIGALFHGTPVKTTKQEYILESGEGTFVDFGGEDLKYNQRGIPKSGEFQEYAMFLQGNAVLYASGFHVTVEDFVGAARTQSNKDDQAAFSQMFAKNDVIAGGNLNDVLLGYAGNDNIVGGYGQDILRGGKGADKFVFFDYMESAPEAADTIRDFSRKEGDRIDVRDMTDFDFVGETETYSGNGPELGYLRSGAYTWVSGDVDGDGVVDFSIAVKGDWALREKDFVL
jgi:Ca2+-binding RTX toxin-like protein